MLILNGGVMRNNIATRRINSFEKSFGKPHLYLAYHAAFPLALTPELLYRLWANFQQDIGGTVMDIPWEAVGDILLSSLCEEVGRELYEMNVEVRSELLRRLKQDPKFGQRRIIRLSDFLLEYVKQQLNSDDVDIRDFAKVQQWTALAYTKPTEVAHQLAQSFQQLQIATSTQTVTDEAEFIRMASLIETFAEPLAEAKLEPLLVYARGMASFARGDLNDAAEQLGKVAENGKIQIAGVDLAIPESVKENLDSPSIPKGQNFSGQKLRGKSFKGQDLTGADFSYTDIRSTDFTNAKLVGANFSHAVMGLQRRWATVLVLYSFLLSILAGVGSLVIGLLFGSFTIQTLQLPEGNRFEINYLILVTSLLELAVLIVIYFSVNIRKGRRAILIALISSLILAPACVVIAFLIIAFLQRISLFSSNGSTSTTAFISAFIGCITFAGVCFLTLRRGIGTFWGTAALAASGTCYYGFSAFLSSSGSSSPPASATPYILWIAAFTVILVVVVMTIFASQNIKRRLILLIGTGLTIALAGILYISQTLSGSNTVLIISLSAIALVTTFASAWFGARIKTLKQVLMVPVPFTVFISLIAYGFLFLRGTLPSEVFIVLIVAVFAIAGSTVSTLSGVAGLRSSIIATVAVYITLALFLASIASRERFLPAVWADGLTGVFSTILIVAFAWAMIVIMAVAIAFAWADAHNFIIALIWSIIIASCGVVILILTMSPSDSTNSSYFVLSTMTGVVAVSISVVGQGSYIAWLALTQRETKFAFIRNFAISFAAKGGTSFRGADLSKANFTQAVLKSADFRQANLTHTSWHKVKKLNYTCVENSYLQYPQAQQLVVTGEGQNQNFDYLNLQGINLREANLADASFIGTNLSQANLREADLSRAKLIDINLEAADFTGASLTGIHIEKWKITDETKLDIISCQYFYRRLPTEDKPDPSRLPEDYQKTFLPGEFAEIIKDQKMLNPELINFPIPDSNELSD